MHLTLKDTWCPLRPLLWIRITSGHVQLHQLLQQVVQVQGSFLSKAVPGQIEKGLIGKIEERKGSKKRNVPLSGIWKFHPALRACPDLGRTYGADDVGVGAAEDGRLGRLEADGAEEVLLFLCNRLLQKLNHLTLDRCCWLPGIGNKK